MVTLFRISSPLATVPRLILAQTRAKSDIYLVNPLSIHIFRWWSESDAAQLWTACINLHIKHVPVHVNENLCYWSVWYLFINKLLSVLTVLGLLIIKCT